MHDCKGTGCLVCADDELYCECGKEVEASSPCAGQCADCFERDMQREATCRAGQHDPVYSGEYYATIPPRWAWVCRHCGVTGIRGMVRPDPTRVDLEEWQRITGCRW